jgi:protein gp37
MEKRFHKGEEGKIVVHPDRLDIPLRRRKPTVYSIWNDWAHEGIASDFLDETFEIIEKCPQHTFLLCTKRATDAVEIMDFIGMSEDSPPLEMDFKNVYFGLTVCNQEEADEKIPIFLQVPGKKFLSLEPMLGPIDLTAIQHDGMVEINILNGDHGVYRPLQGRSDKKIDAVILGGETGPGARPMHPDWVRSVRDQCSAADVPFFFKQWGEWTNDIDSSLRCKSFIFNPIGNRLPVQMYRVGRNKAGRLLDGREHNELQWILPEGLR